MDFYCLKYCFSPQVLKMASLDATTEFKEEVVRMYTGRG